MTLVKRTSCLLSIPLSVFIHKILKILQYIIFYTHYVTLKVPQIQFYVIQIISTKDIPLKRHVQNLLVNKNKYDFLY